jgi:hypothetical protein
MPARVLARYGAAPPLPPEVPVPLPPPPVLPVVGVAVPGTAAPPEPPEPVLPVAPEAAPEPVLPVEPEPVEPAAEEEPEVVEPVVVVEEVDGVLVVALSVGMVRVGAPEVSAVLVLPPPQAARPTATAAPAKRAASELVMRARRVVTTRTSGPEGVHPASAVRAVVQVLLGELVAPIAEAQVLDGPGELGGRGGQGEEDGHGLEGLVGLTVQVGAAGLGFDHYLAARGGRA